MVNHYATLDLSRNATVSDIKKAYRKMARKWHPDKNLNCQDQATKKFKEISEAYKVLSCEKKRSIYDKTYRKEGPSSATSSSTSDRKRHQKQPRSSARKKYRSGPRKEPSFSFQDLFNLLGENYRSAFQDLFNLFGENYGEPLFGEFFLLLL